MCWARLCAGMRAVNGIQETRFRGGISGNEGRLGADQLNVDGGQRHGAIAMFLSPVRVGLTG
jgi:hypothetical protein